MTERFNAKQWLLICFLLRLAVIPFTFHGDLSFLYRAPHYVLHGEWDVYGMVAKTPGKSFYPPLTVIYFVCVQFFFQYFIPGYEVFTHSLANQNPAVGVIEVKQLMESQYVFTSLFFMKLPYLIFDFLLIKIFLKMLPDKRKKKYFIVFWAVNPVVIYGTYMVGQFDLIPAFLVVLAYYYSLQQGKEHFACLSLSIGFLFKIFPIVFLPIVLLVSSRSIKDFIRLFLYGTVPAVFFYFLFYLVSGKATFLLFDVFSYNFSLATDQSIFVLRACQAIVCALVGYHIIFLSQRKFNNILLSQYFLLVYFSCFWGLPIASTHYFIWLTPFLIFYTINNSKWNKAYYFLLIVIFLCGLKSRASCFGIFAPINSEFFLSIPSLKDITGFLFQQNVYDQTLRIIYDLVTGIWTVAILKHLYFKREINET